MLASIEFVRRAPQYAAGVSVYTFGSPRVGNGPFATEHRAAVPDCWSVINNQVGLMGNGMGKTRGGVCVCDCFGVPDVPQILPLQGMPRRNPGNWRCLPLELRAFDAQPCAAVRPSHHSIRTRMLLRGAWSPPQQESLTVADTSLIRFVPHSRPTHKITPPPRKHQSQDPIPRIPKGWFHGAGHRVVVTPRGDLIIKPSTLELSVIFKSGGVAAHHRLPNYSLSLFSLFRAQFDAAKKMEGGALGVTILAGRLDVGQTLVLRYAGLREIMDARERRMPMPVEVYQLRKVRVGGFDWAGGCCAVAPGRQPIGVWENTWRPVLGFEERPHASYRVISPNPGPDSDNRNGRSRAWRSGQSAAPPRLSHKMTPSSASRPPSSWPSRRGPWGRRMCWVTPRWSGTWAASGCWAPRSSRRRNPVP